MAKKLRSDAQKLGSEALLLCRQLKLVWRRPDANELAPTADPHSARRADDERVE